MKLRGKQFWLPALACLLICVLCAVIVISLRHRGRLRSLELITYDLFLKFDKPEHPSSLDVTIVGITEHDISQVLRHYPVSDRDLTAVLKSILQHEPRAIGIDIVRDIPVGDGTEGNAELVALLKSNPNIIMISESPFDPEETIPAPTGLTLRQVGFNDLPEDPDGMLRRGLISASDQEGKTFVSLSMRLAALYFKPLGITPKLNAEKRLQIGAWTFVPLDVTKGPYYLAKTDAPGNQYLIDYRNAGGFPRIRFTDAMRGQIEDRLIRGRVMLVGITAKSVKDTIVTPVAGRQFGVEAHANLVDQIIRTATRGERQLLQLPPWRDDGWICLWTALGGLLGVLVRSPLRLSISVLVGVAVVVLIGFLAFRHGFLLPIVPPVLGWIGSAAVVTSYMSNRESQNRRALMSLFGKHVSPGIASEIWAKRDEFFERGRLIAQEMEATVLFTDLKGFSMASEAMSPGVLMSWLNDYFQSMSGVVEQYHGGINKFNGDQLLAIFGPPLMRTTPEEIAEDANNAVECAMAMRHKLAQLNAEWKAQHRPTTRMRIGISSGRLVAGSLGSKERLEYTVIGNTVNVAARLESFEKTIMDDDIAADGCRILISEGTYAHLAGKFRTRLLTEVQLPGMTHTISIHGVLERASNGETEKTLTDRRNLTCESAPSHRS